MASTGKPLNYEEERQSIIEENKRRMQELGLIEIVESFRQQTTPKKTRIPRMSINLELAMETRRSSRSASRPKVDYKEAGMDAGLGRTRGIKRPLLRRGYVSPAAKNEAAVRAADIKTSHPSFVKAMLKSHTSGGFWLGLPSDFCYKNFTKDDIIVLEDEDGLEWECVYLHHKHGLSGGWRGFSLDHELEDGDAVVFELVTSSRFKIYITRASDSEEPSIRKKPALAKKGGYQYVVKDSINMHVHSDLHKALKREKGELVDGYKGVVRKKSKSTKTTRNVRRGRLDGSSDESQESEDDVVDTSNDGSHSVDESVEDSDNEASAQSIDEDIQPAGKSKNKIFRPTRRSCKSKQHFTVVDIDSDEDKPEQKSDDDIQSAADLKRKMSPVPKVAAKPRQNLKAKTKSKARHISPGRNKNSRASMKVLKKETAISRADRKCDMQGFRKEIAARQVEQKCNLPPGTRLKPVGVCSIARGSTKRKLPAIYPARKYSFFSGPKSIKVH